MPSGLAAVAIPEPEQGGEFRVVDFDGRLGAVHDRADQDALLALVERCCAGGRGVGLRSHGFWLVCGWVKVGRCGCRGGYVDVWMLVCGYEGILGLNW